MHPPFLLLLFSLLSAPALRAADAALAGTWKIDLARSTELNPWKDHVRESNSVEKVAAIFAKLSEPAEVVPLDLFLKLAASAQTYRVHHQKPTDPVDHNP